MLSPRYGTIPWGDQPATEWQVEPLPPWKRQLFVLKEVVLILLMDLPFLHAVPLPKSPSMDLENITSTNMLFHIVVLLAEKLDSWPTVMEPTDLTTLHSSLKRLA